MAEAKVTVKFRLLLECFCGRTYDVAENGVELLHKHLIHDHDIPVGPIEPEGTDG